VRKLVEGFIKSLHERNFIMDPITLGIASIVALVLSACGGGSGGINDKRNAGNNDASTAETGGNGGTGGTGANTSTGGSGGTSGTGGMGGTGGAGGSVGVDAGTDSGADAYVDATIPDGSHRASVPYHFGMIYGSGSIQGFRGTGFLYFSDANSCQLLGGSFDGEFQSGAKITLSVDLAGNQSIDLCAANATLPLAGGIFDGMSWMLTNHSTPLTSKQSYEITACSSQNDGGAIQNCSGALEMTIP
jgi:hypothetical protein